MERLAEIFGTIQGAVAEGLVRERAGGALRDGLTGLPAHAELHEWLQVLIAEYRRYGHPFALALLNIVGLDRINSGVEVARQGDLLRRQGLDPRTRSPT